MLPTSLLESSPGDAKERRYLERLNHVRRMDRSLDGVTHREFFGGADARLATARTLLPWYNRSYMPDETLVAADGTPIVHVPRLSQALTQALSDIDQAKAAAKTAVHAQASKQGDPSVVPGVVLDAATLAQLAHMQSREDVLTAGLAAHEENTKLELQRMRDDYDAKKAEQRGQMLDELERVRASMGLLAARAERAQMPPPAMPMAATAPSALYLYHGGLDDPGAAIAAAHGAEMKGEAAIKAMLVAARADRRDWEYDGMRSGGSAVTVLFLLASTAVAFTPSAAWRPLPASALRRADAPLLVDQAAPRADAPISDVELQVQSAKLDALSAKWEKREKEVEYAESLRSGWGPSPERINGRFAMFFLIVGLITEYYTGQSVPQQCYTMLQTLSIVD
eukprot:jgi/Chrpa1/20897/Chrysochromulina_OHIO_Genome00006442-RA